MNKNIRGVKIGAIGLIFGILLFVLLKVVFPAVEKNEFPQEIQHLPELNMKTIDGRNFSKSDLRKKTTIVVYFNTECSYSQNQANVISKNLNKLKHFQFLFVSTYPIEKIKDFATEYSLINQSNITFLHDHSKFFREIGIKTVPYNLIYDEDQNLFKTYRGALKLPVLLGIEK